MSDGILSRIKAHILSRSLLNLDIYEIPNGLRPKSNGEESKSIFDAIILKKTIDGIKNDNISLKTLESYRWSILRIFEYCFDYNALNSFRKIVNYNRLINNNYLEIFVGITLIYNKLPFYQLLIDDFHWPATENDLSYALSPEIIRFIANKGVKLTHIIYLNFCDDFSIDIIMQLKDEFKIPYAIDMVLRTIECNQFECFKFLLPDCQLDSYDLLMIKIIEFERLNMKTYLEDYISKNIRLYN